jgi:hypothetical protein
MPLALEKPKVLLFYLAKNEPPAAARNSRASDSLNSPFGLVSDPQDADNPQKIKSIRLFYNRP